MIAVACDHTALPMKQAVESLLNEMGLPYRDFGTDSDQSCDYPVFAQRAATAVASGECDRGIVICGTGIGMSITANKVKGIRCALCSEPFSAELSRRHNNANMLALGARTIGTEMANKIVTVFLTTPFDGGRHQRRLNIITEMEEGKGK